jgi:hypothetical protein
MTMPMVRVPAGAAGCEVIGPVAELRHRGQHALFAILGDRRRPVSTFDTVAGATDASSATSRMVGGLPCRLPPSFNLASRLRSRTKSF